MSPTYTRSSVFPDLIREEKDFSAKNRLPVDAEDLDGCCMHGDCARHCIDDMCHGNVCENCPESEDDEEYDDDEV